jgi:hypothetical protein
LLDVHDAVADLALAEGVHQAVQGNYDRAAATLETYSSGNFPPEPEVVQTPRSGIGLTHRVGLQLPAGLDPAESPFGDIAVSPRAGAEPALNAWLASILPPPAGVGCKVTFSAPVNGVSDVVITQQALQLQPIDLLHLLQPQREAAMSELEDRILRHVIESLSPRPDVALTISYTPRLPGKISFFELTALAGALRALVLRSRPLRASDVTLQNEATQDVDATVFLSRARIDSVLSALNTLHGNLTAFYAVLAAQLADLGTHQAQLVADIDATITAFVALMARAASHGIPETGWGVAYAWRRQRFLEVLGKVADLRARWSDKLSVFDQLLADYDLLPAETTEEQRFELLQSAEWQIATRLTTPMPATAAAYRASLAIVRSNFAARLDQFVAVATLNSPALANLLAAIRLLLPVTGFDPQPFTLVEVEAQVVAFARDLANLAQSTAAEIAKRRDAVQAHLAAHDAAAQPLRQVDALQNAAKAVFGEEFQLIPEFTLAADHGNEWEKALADSTSGVLFGPASQLHDFPVDDWLYGLARVREKMRHWEQVVMLAAALGGNEPALIPIQLPYQPNDVWLGLEFPPEHKIDREQLLYTAHYGVPFQKTARQCGLLLDEWTEVIPAPEETTGITFHYDRPNSEPPQTMLLVTPAQLGGRWNWQDLVDTLGETLDIARRRAVEPQQVDRTVYARLLPATVMAVTVYQISIAANLALNNNVYALME